MIARPGAISRAHAGVLFLDEAPEFPARVLDTLRQPLESGEIVLHRAYGAARYPARFQLVLAANPCPCGNKGVRGQSARALLLQQRRYFGRLSGPLLDRIDIHIDVAPVTRGATEGEPTAVVAERVARCSSRGSRRLAGTGWTQNSQTSARWLRANTPSASLEAGQAALDRGAVSARGLDRSLRVAWSIADLAGGQRPSKQDVMQALALRNAGAHERDRATPLDGDERAALDRVGRARRGCDDVASWLVDGTRRRAPRSVWLRDARRRSCCGDDAARAARRASSHRQGRRRNRAVDSSPRRRAIRGARCARARAVGARIVTRADERLARGLRRDGRCGAVRAVGARQRRSHALLAAVRGGCRLPCVHGLWGARRRRNRGRVVRRRLVRGLRRRLRDRCRRAPSGAHGRHAHRRRDGWGSGSPLPGGPRRPAGRGRWRRASCSARCPSASRRIARGSSRATDSSPRRRRPAWSRPRRAPVRSTPSTTPWRFGGRLARCPAR